jgi:hypothetical protein
MKAGEYIMQEPKTCLCIYMLDAIVIFIPPELTLFSISSLTIHSGQIARFEFSVLCVSDKELWHLNNSESFTQPEYMQLLQHLISYPLHNDYRSYKRLILH